MNMTTTQPTHHGDGRLRGFYSSQVTLICWNRFEYSMLLYTKYFSHSLIPVPFTMMTFIQVFIFDNHFKIIIIFIFFF